MDAWWSNVKQKHAKWLLKSNILCNVNIGVTAHSSLISSKRVIRTRDLAGVDDDEILENLSSEGLISVKRVTIRR